MSRSSFSKAYEEIANLEPMEMTFTINDADLDKLSEILKDINVKECPWFEVQDKHGVKAKYYREPQWIPIWPEDPNTFPSVDKEGYSDYVLLSFSNCSGLIIGQYRVDEDGGAFYAGDDEEPLTVHDLYVNAWQPLPSPYSEEVEEE